MAAIILCSISGIDAAQRAVVWQRRGSLERNDRPRRERGLAENEDMAGDAGADAGQQLLGDRASGDPGGRLAGARALQDVANISAAVLGDAREVCVARPRPGDRCPSRAAAFHRRLALDIGADAHRVLPVRPVAILDHHRDRPADRLARPHAREDVRAIRLDGHAPAPAVTALPPAEVACDGIEIEREPGRNAFENHDERAPM